MDAAASPPSYSRSAAVPPCPPVLLNLAPLAAAPPTDSDSDSDRDATSFQLGLLGAPSGAKRPQVAGEVQVKCTGATTASSSSSPGTRYRSLVVAFIGTESDTRGNTVTLFEQHATLWERTDGADVDATPPAVSPFRFDLTPDLPTCIHLASSSLSYSLTATLYPFGPILSTEGDDHDDDDPAARPQPLSRCVPVHLVRTASPSALVPVQSATVTASDPIRWSVRFPRTTFTRREPIGLVVRVEVPDSKRIEQGLRLRTVSAELVRTITTTPIASARRRSLKGSPGAAAAATDEPVVERRTVLAHSGKSARFSPSRPIIIRLVLHPPLEPACESISQSTISHTVEFRIVVTVGLVNTGSASSSANLSAAGASTSSAAAPPSTLHGGPTPLDSVLTQELVILPDLPPSVPPAHSRSEKLKEVERDAAAAATSTAATRTTPLMPSSPSSWEEEQPDAPVPSYVENSLLDPGTATVTGHSLPTASTSAGWLEAETAAALGPTFPPLRRSPPPVLPPSGYTLSASYDPIDGEAGRREEGEEEEEEEEEEYDGYEELSLSASLSERPPPPRIDDDISPPSAAEPSSAFGYRLAADSGEVVILPAGGGGGEDDSREGRRGVEDDLLPPLLEPTSLVSGSPSPPPPPSLGEPETPPPPVDYDLSAPPFAPVSSLAGDATVHAPHRVAEYVTYSRAAPVARHAANEEPPIPSSPPPPLSPLLDPNHHLETAFLPPFSPHPALSSSTPSSPPPPPVTVTPLLARPRRHSRESSGGQGSPELDIGASPPGSGSPEGLPPPYAGRLHPFPPPEMTSATRPASGQVVVRGQHRVVLDPPPRPWAARSHSRSSLDYPAATVTHSSLPAAPPVTALPLRERVRPMLAPIGHDAYPDLPEQHARRIEEDGGEPVDGVDRDRDRDRDRNRDQDRDGDRDRDRDGDRDGDRDREGRIVVGGDDEFLRPPPYEQRDESAVAAGLGGNGIQWGMMHMTNRRGELVL
ncbi:hypothetical protein JCM3774_000259 [Rhodotorula dairenensis]